MPAKVILTITEGSLKGEEFEFDSRTTCIMERADEFKTAAEFKRALETVL